MVVPKELLDARFSKDEILSATELQETAASRLQERVARHHKLLLTHYNRAVGVLLDCEGFEALVARIKELEEAVEELEAAQFIDRRLGQGVGAEDWLNEEQFAEHVKRLLLSRQKSDEN